SYTASDNTGGSGLASPSSDSFTFSDTTNGSHTFTVTDLAGNSTSVTASGIQQDTVAPSITASATTVDDNAAYTPRTSTNQNVKVHFSATDDTSGVDSTTADQTLSAEGANQSVSGTVTDIAGNSNSADFTGINIDLTKPTSSASSPASANTTSFTVS